ncbi:MAG: hypothetical protein RAO75_00145 [Candidatus Chlorobium antarcticum]|nr:hypothetical protein [Candidatus Chlorobium antarcticum]
MEREGFEPEERVRKRPKAVSTANDSETAPLGVKGLRPGINPSLSADKTKASSIQEAFCVIERRNMEREGFEPEERVRKRPKAVSTANDSETAPLGVKGLRPGINPSLSADKTKASSIQEAFCVIERRNMEREGFEPERRVRKQPQAVSTANRQ